MYTESFNKASQELCDFRAYEKKTQIWFCRTGFLMTWPQVTLISLTGESVPLNQCM